MKRLTAPFNNRSLGFKFTLAFILVILIPMMLLAYISYRTMDARLLADAQEKIDIGFKIAATEYSVRAEQMRYGMLQAASMQEIKSAIKRGDRRYLKKMMTALKKERPYVDIWAVLDENGRVIARLNSDIAGDKMDANDLVQKALLSGDAQSSTEILPVDLLKKEGNGFREQFIVPITSRGSAGEYKRPGKNIEENAMAAVVATPVSAENNAIIGAIVTADILNNDMHIPDTIAGKMKGLYATIAMDGLRISTNVTDSAGQRAVGTLLAASSAAKLNSGENIRGEADVLGQTHISAFDPIKDNKGKVIGSLYVGMPKTRLWLLQKENQVTIIMITAFGLVMALAAAFIATYKITRPLRTLKQKTEAFASGDIEARIDVEECPTRDELKILARTFNVMTDDIKKRGEERERHLKELVEKNTELSELNEKFKRTNEELEVAYEETQSQAEELHSANEELRLLNEDLDKKNIELTEANKMIKNEGEDLKRTKNKLKLIYDGIRAHLLLVEEDCTVLEANRSFLEALKLSESHVVGKKLYDLFGFNREEHLKVCPATKSIATGATAEAEIATNDGKILHYRSFPLSEAGGGWSKAVVYIEDITEKKLLLQRLIQSDKLSSLGELVSGVAHELNNPLTGIMGYSELLLNAAADEKTKKRLKDINDASHRCKRIIENLLTFARFHKPEKIYSDINRIISDTVELRAYQLKVDNINVEFDLDNLLPKTMVDGNQLQQVLLNLINNAQHAITEKGEKGRIGISSRRAENNLRITVTDTGAGIPDNIANRLFDPFFTTKPAGKGTGLGLSISYGIIKEHGGNIYAMSKHGEGTAFVVELPIIEEQDKDKAIPSDTGVKQKHILEGAGQRALILDDEPAILEFLREVLSDKGFHVDTTSRGDEALNMLKENDYALIVSDIKLPGMNGKEFYSKLTSIKPEAAGNLIFMSGDTASKGTQNFLKQAGTPFLHKPFAIESFEAIISKKI